MMGEDEKGKIVKEHADINKDIALDDILTQPSLSGRSNAVQGGYLSRGE